MGNYLFVFESPSMFFIHTNRKQDRSAFIPDLTRHQNALQMDD